MNKEFKKGTKLIAIDPCIMDGDKDYQALTVGEIYTAEVVDSNYLEVTDNYLDLHRFSLSLDDKENWTVFFKLCP